MTTETTAPPVKAMENLKVDENGAKAESATVDKAKFKEQFQAFSKFGDVKSDGKQITLSQSDKWMKQAGVIDKKITTTDTGIHFKKLKSMKLGIVDYSKFLDDLAKTKGVEVAELKNKLASCGAPGSNSKVSVSFIFTFHNSPNYNFKFQSDKKAEETVARLTDTSKYTGSHKLRFDETGKGKGIAGRKDVNDGTGYVSGYQHKNTYDKTH